MKLTTILKKNLPGIVKLEEAGLCILSIAAGPYRVAVIEVQVADLEAAKDVLGEPETTDADESAVRYYWHLGDARVVCVELLHDVLHNVGGDAELDNMLDQQIELSLEQEQEVNQ